MFFFLAPQYTGILSLLRKVLDEQQLVIFEVLFSSICHLQQL